MRASLARVSGKHFGGWFLLHSLRLVLGGFVVFGLLRRLLLLLQLVVDPLSLPLDMVLQGPVELVIGFGACFPLGVAFQAFPLFVAAPNEIWEQLGMELTIVLELGVIQLLLLDQLEQRLVDVLPLDIGELLIQVLRDVPVAFVHMVCFYLYK